MKIYTEINYEWLDGQLVKTDSKSFDYEGELTLCVGGSFGSALGSVGLGAVTTNSGGGGSTPTEVVETFTEPVADVVTTVTEPIADIVPDDPVGNLQDAVQDVTGDDPVGQFQEDVGTQADAAETSINETVATTMDTGQSNLEGILEDNNDTLIDMGNTFDYNVDQGNALLANTQAVVHDASSLINLGAGAVLDINNPNSLISSPVNWYEEAAGVGKGGWDTSWITDAQNEYLEDAILGGVQWWLESTGIDMNYQDEDEGGGGGGGTTDPGAAMYSGNRAIHGDPFASPAKTRRVVQQKEDFQSRLKKDQATSLING